MNILIPGLAATLLACGAREQTTTLPPPARVTQNPPAASRTEGRYTGPILETMNAAGYTYMRLGTQDGEVWTAVRETKVTKGATVTVEAQMVAEKFQSSALHRTFDKLVMGTLVDGQAKEVPASVERAKGGLTIAEAWAKRSELNGKPVVIRGTVVKFLGGIMGKNWVHLRDGSGSSADGNDDITVTTSEVAQVGDVVTISGTVHADKDFGSGYRYPVIVEDAKLQK